MTGFTAWKIDRMRGLGPRLIGIASLMVLLTILAAPAAFAQLASVGPVDPANGFPTWYQDKTGLALEFCQNATQAELAGGWCALLPANVPNGTAPETFPGNFSIEHFYWLANVVDRQINVPGAAPTTVGLFMAQEGSFANNISVINGDQIVFSRIRIKVSPVPFSGDYTVYTPYGKFVFPNQTAGDRIFFTTDVGLSPLNFTLSLNGRIGPYLVPSAAPGGAEVPPIPDLLAVSPGTDPFYDALAVKTAYPANGSKYLADPARIGPVTGSLQGLYTVNDQTTRDPNIFRVEGPNGFVYENVNFSVTGRVYTGAIAGDLQVKRASYARSGAGQSIDVYASASPATQGRVPALAPPAPLTPSLSYYDVPCTATLDANGNPGPPYSAPVGATAHQMLDQGSNYYGDGTLPGPGIPVTICVAETAANAAGQTVTTYTSANLGDQVSITEALYDAATQSMSVKAASSDQLALPTLTVVGYGDIPAVAAGAIGQLVVSGVFAPPETVTVVSAGRGTNDFQMSSGPIAGAGGGTLAPIAVNDTAAVNEDCSATPATSCAAGAAPIINVLANDTNAAGGTVAITTAPLLGTAVINADQSITYTPKPNVNGSDSFSYQVTVGTQVSNTAVVAITITPVNDAPVAVNDTAGAVRGFATSINVLANDTDPDGVADLAGVVIVNGNATLGIQAGPIAGGIVSFTPSAAAVAGAYPFTYQAVDKSGALSANVATVTVNVSTGEAIVPTKAIYTQKTQQGVTNVGRWTVAGTISPIAGQTMTITYDLTSSPSYKVNGACTLMTVATNPVIGTAVVDATGNWLFDLVLTNTTGVSNPSNTLGNSTGFWCAPPQKVRITSSATNGSQTFAISLK